MDFDGFTKKSLSILRGASPVLKILVNDLENVNKQIDEIDIHIAERWETNQYARIIETIPRIGKYGSLSIASEIGDVDRFPKKDNIFSSVLSNSKM